MPPKSTVSHQLPTARDKPPAVRAPKSGAAKGGAGKGGVEAKGGAAKGGATKGGTAKGGSSKSSSPGSPLARGQGSPLRGLRLTRCLRYREAFFLTCRCCLPSSFCVFVCVRLRLCLSVCLSVCLCDIVVVTIEMGAYLSEQPRRPRSVPARRRRRGPRRRPQSKQRKKQRRPSSLRLSRRGRKNVHSLRTRTQTTSESGARRS